MKALLKDHAKKSKQSQVSHFISKVISRTLEIYCATLLNM